MKQEIITGSVGTGISFIGTAIQTNELLQTISLVISIIGGIITFIIVPLLTWYNKAKSDGKISKEETKECIDIVKTGTGEIKKIMKKSEKED